MKYLDICSALYDYTAQNEEEISFKTQDVLYILEKEDPDWHKAQLKVPNTDGPIGLIPANYIEKVILIQRKKEEEKLTKRKKKDKTYCKY